ncbi:MAG: hypothetical protein NTY66_03550, partial [Candidatus Vogelbacteria bacterium]|nr:hypothetical protein [Candidatus Vogelbacteria bacterium]
LYPIVLGERTHDGSLILHGDQDGQALDMGEYAKLDPSDRSELTKLVRRYLPRKPDDIVKALSYMLSCNLEYIEERGRSHAPRVETHEETGLYVGFYDSSGLTGRRLNQVLVLGICHPNLREQVAVMTKMIDHNRRRLEVDNGVLIICRQFRGEDRRVLASFEAERLARKVIGWIAKDVSAMRDYFQLLVGVTDLSGDHSFERIEL